ncbi:MAG: sulfite exporter TauE/SafE family protein [Actinomycetota bacterium]
MFVTGLLAGGASCAVVQGGLLAGVVSRRKGVLEPLALSGKSKKKKSPKPPAQPRFSGPQDLIPVGGFLIAKLISHTILGALLGLVGERVQVSFRTQAMMQILAGAVMLIMALDLFGVHSVRRLIPSPPSSWTALVRRRAKSSDAMAPAALGFMTVLIPCGVTLSMELLAIASGSPITGALIMAIFVVGTSPLFAVLGYAFRRASSALGGNLGKVAAVAVVIVGMITINSGLVLAGSPISFGANSSGSDSAAPVDDTVEFPGGEVAGPIAPDSGGGEDMQTLVVEVQDRGYSPGSIKARAGVPVKLLLKTKGTQGCTRAFVIPDLNIQKVLPETGQTEINLGTLRKGVLEYTCSMGMYGGDIRVS